MADDEKTKQSKTQDAAQASASEAKAGATKGASALSPTPPAPPEPEVKGGKTRMGKGVLIVTGPETGRRRAGLTFGKAPVEVDASILSAEQVDAIQNDPLLSVKSGK